MNTQCICGHTIEEHEDERGPCEAVVVHWDGETIVEECKCVMFEEDEEE